MKKIVGRSIHMIFYVMMTCVVIVMKVDHQKIIEVEEI